MKKIIVIFFIALGLIVANGNLEVQAQPTISNNGMFYRTVEFAANGLLNSLTSLWGLDETSGTTAFDSHGANDLSNSNVSVNQTGIIGTAYYYNGVNANSVSSSRIVTSIPFSISGWAYFVDTDSYMLITTNNFSNRYYGVEFRPRGDGSISLQYGDGTGSGPLDRYSLGHQTGAISLPGWYHFVLVVNGFNDHEIYMNGELVTVTPSSSGTASSISVAAGVFDIGRSWNFGAYREGRVDQVGVWGRALTATDAALLASVVPYANFTVRVEQSIKSIYNRYYENISDVEIPLRIAS